MTWLIIIIPIICVAYLFVYCLFEIDRAEMPGIDEVDP